MVKKKKKKVLPRETKSRAQYKCPERVEYWLAVMKEFVPPSFELPEWKNYNSEKRLEYLREKKITWFQDENEENDLEFKTIQTFIQTQIGELKTLLWAVTWKYLQAEPVIADVPLKEHILANKKTIREYTKFAIYYCEQVLLTMFIIRHLAKHFEEVRKGNIPKETSTGFHIPVMVNITPQNKVSISAASEFLEAINKTDADRLRICEICQRVFWAKREDSKTCSPRCLSALNTRNSRKLTAEEKAEKKAQREANRERNKKLKQLKEQK
jgi:hypothetical protein